MVVPLQHRKHFMFTVITVSIKYAKDVNDRCDGVSGTVAAIIGPTKLCQVMSSHCMSGVGSPLLHVI